jgi:hypothetical protein
VKEIRKIGSRRRNKKRKGGRRKRKRFQNFGGAVCTGNRDSSRLLNDAQAQSISCTRFGRQSVRLQNAGAMGKNT